MFLEDEWVKATIMKHQVPSHWQLSYIPLARLKAGGKQLAVNGNALNLSPYAKQAPQISIKTFCLFLYHIKDDVFWGMYGLKRPLRCL